MYVLFSILLLTYPKLEKSQNILYPSFTAGLLSNALHRLHLHPCNPLKVTAVVGEKGQVVLQSSGSDEQIEVTDEGACGSETAAFSAKDLDNGLVETKYSDTTKKVLRSCASPSGSRE